ncbi:Uncharacterized protein APZ42_033811 [Daphnia magna]|uniref:Uncharacterized protein n=1 Tax=Daphnia magna TaxID=35525 RepID=A0A164KQ51_9CRUS|nr:Uncharacterized protein APZ42_033811 [Daphnia magna]
MRVVSLIFYGLVYHSLEREDASHYGGSAFWNSTTMNDDVVTGGHKLVHSPVNKQSRPEITVTLPDQETVAGSLDFETWSLKLSLHKIHFRVFRKLRSNAAYKAVAGLDTTYSRKTRASATSESPPKVATKTSSLASTVLGFFHTKNTPKGKSLEPQPEPPIQQSQERSRQDIPDLGEQASVPNTCDQEPERERSGFPVERPEGSDPDNSADTGHPTDKSISRRPKPIDGVEGTNDPSEVLDVDPRVSQHNRLAERQVYLGINPELWDYIETQRGSILPSFARSGRPIHPLEDGIAGLSTNIFGGHSQPYLIPTRAATTDSTGTTDARDQLTAEEVGQFPRSQQTEQRTAHRGDQTNALPDQNSIEATAITGYQRTDIAAIRVTIASTAAVENNSTTDTSTIHRPPPYSATTQSAYKSTQPFPGTTVQVDTRRCCEPRSPTSSVSTQSQTSQQGNLRFRLPVPKNNLAYCTSPTRAATVRDLDDFQNNQHTFSRLQLLPSFTGSPNTRFDSWLESFESIVDG